MSTSRPYRFLFLIGASGSGTSMLSRLLGTPANCVCLGGSDVSVPREQRAAYRLVKQFQKANDHVWNRWESAERAGAGRRRMLEKIDALLAMPGYEQVDTVVFKRSAPFHRGDRYRPDLRDIDGMFRDYRILAIYRDPRASSASSYRRKFADNLRACAVITEEQLTCVSAQLATFPQERIASFGYEDFCREPMAHIDRIAAFCGLDAAPLEEAIAGERVAPDRIDAWKKRLDTEAGKFLDDYFDERRRSQWSHLSRTWFPGVANAT